MSEAPQRLKILFLTPRFPYPLVGGDRLKSYHLLKHLAKHHDVTLVSFPAAMPDDESLAHVKGLGLKVLVPQSSYFKALLHTGLHAFGKLPLEIAYFTQPAGVRMVEKLLKEEKFDLGISFFMRTAEFLKNAPFKKILIAEDCRTLYQSRSLASSKSLKQKIVRWWEVRKLKKYEPQIVNNFDAITLVTPEDAEAMRKQNPKPPYYVLTNGTDIHHIQPNFDHRTRTGVLFTGNFRLYANILMLLKILDKILPQIQKQLPDTHISIVGSAPPPEVLKRASKHVYIHADVPDFLPYLQSAAIFLHPHEGATGIQNKILEAMAAGCPVITTPTGIQGIPARHGEEVLVAHSNEEMATYAVQLLKDPNFREKLARNARKLIEQKHSWEAVEIALDDVIEKVLQALF